jgi:uncharacterized membrane protein YhhN
MTYTLLWLALICAIVDWIAVAAQIKKLEYFAKPGTMLLLIVWILQVSGPSGILGSGLFWFVLGLAFSLAGDVFLMLPREQFIAGLLSFLLAHVAYIIGINQIPPVLNLPAVILVFAVGLVWFRLYRIISMSLKSSGQSKLVMPVLVYSLVISIMLLSALLTLTAERWDTAAALQLSAGALLFFISDTLLAWNKFVNPLRFGRLAVIITYHLGQVLITLGAIQQFLVQTSI